MGSVPLELVRELQAQLDLRRAIETGTYKGRGTRLLAGVFPEVVTIELSAELHRRSGPELERLPGVYALQGDSRAVVPQLVDPQIPTLYFLDGHWSGGITAGEDEECPVLEELAAISEGNERDCVLIDDARLFAAPPPPPHDASQWPTLTAVFDSLRQAHPEHHVTMLGDLVIAVPPQARPVVDAFGQELFAMETNTLQARMAGLSHAALGRARALRGG